MDLKGILNLTGRNIDFYEDPNDRTSLKEVLFSMGKISFEVHPKAELGKSKFVRLLTAERTQIKSPIKLDWHATTDPPFCSGFVVEPIIATFILANKDCAFRFFDIWIYDQKNPNSLTRVHCGSGVH